jgi:hypothetical protein
MSKGWKPVAEMDDKRRNLCRVRMVDGREMKAIWGVHVLHCGEAYCWAAEDNKVYGLHDVTHFRLLDSLPIGSLPGGECTDEELLADGQAKKAKRDRKAAKVARINPVCFGA